MVRIAKRRAEVFIMPLLYFRAPMKSIVLRKYSHCPYILLYGIDIHCLHIMVSHTRNKSKTEICLAFISHS